MSLIYQKKYGGDPQAFGKTVVLLGGLSAERDISLKSGGAILHALKRKGVNAFAIDVQHDLIEKISSEAVERVFIALHGPGGEDGKVQALLETLNIPYTGSGHAASAIAMDKRKTKLIWQGLGLPTPNSVLLNQESDWTACLQQLGGQAFIKPVHEGSSIGMSCVTTADQMQQAFAKAAKFDAEVLAESRIIGKEYTVTILGDRALPAIQLLPKNVFYDFDAKYVSEETQYLCPAQLETAKEEELKQLAIDSFYALGCSGWGRVDVMLSKDGKFYLLEVNTVPGMTDHSLVPMAAKEVGLEFDDLVLEILCQTLT